eukprot:scaffold13419_cov129-Isochrysis_galbana.AAC.1
MQQPAGDGAGVLPPKVRPAGHVRANLPVPPARQVVEEAAVPSAVDRHPGIERLVAQPADAVVLHGGRSCTGPLAPPRGSVRFDSGGVGRGGAHGRQVEQLHTAVVTDAAQRPHLTYRRGGGGSGWKSGRRRLSARSCDTAGEGPGVLQVRVWDARPAGPGRRYRGGAAIARPGQLGCSDVHIRGVGAAREAGADPLPRNEWFVPPPPRAMCPCLNAGSYFWGTGLGAPPGSSGTAPA